MLQHFHSPDVDIRAYYAKKLKFISGEVRFDNEEVHFEISRREAKISFDKDSLEVAVRSRLKGRLDKLDELFERQSDVKELVSGALDVIDELTGFAFREKIRRVKEKLKSEELKAW